MTDTRAERAREVMPEDIALLIAKHYAATPDTRRMLQSDIYKALTAFAADEVALALEEAATIAEIWDSPVTDSEFVNAQAIAAQQIAARIRALKEGNTP